MNIELKNTRNMLCFFVTFFVTFFVAIGADGD
jgi:hypothetical protein